MIITSRVTFNINGVNLETPPRRKFFSQKMRTCLGKQMCGSLREDQ